jgi:single-strand DNA-binding protein
MATDNHTTIVGNLIEDPEVRFTNNGTAVANLRVAVTQRVQHDGEWRDGDTSFLKVNVWREQAEHLADSPHKGDRVMVTGRLRQRSWETPEGDKRSVTEIEADAVGASLKWATAKVERDQPARQRRPHSRKGAAGGRAGWRLQRRATDLEVVSQHGVWCGMIPRHGDLIDDPDHGRAARPRRALVGHPAAAAGQAAPSQGRPTLDPGPGRARRHHLGLAGRRALAAAAGQGAGLW